MDCVHELALLARKLRIPHNFFAPPSTISGLHRLSTPGYETVKDHLPKSKQDISDKSLLLFQREYNFCNKDKDIFYVLA